MRLYVIPGSHPCDCVEAGLRMKDIAYERVDLLPPLHKLVMAARFPGKTVPGLALDGERIVGSRQILRRLEELEPEPRLLPADAARRARVEEAEEWGDEVLQPLARRVAWASLRREPRAMMSYVGDARLGLPKPLVRAGCAPAAWLSSSLNKAGDANAEADLRALPAHLDTVDSWLAEGVLGGESANVADLQIGSSLRLLLTFGDVRPLVEGHLCAALAERWFGPSPGSVPAGTLPAGWVAGPA